MQYTGPCKIICPLECDVPEGVVMTVMPRPRHNWGGMVHCPNIEEECELSFQVDQSPLKEGDR